MSFDDVACPSREVGQASSYSGDEGRVCLERRLAKELGAAHGWLLDVSSEEALRLGVCPHEDTVMLPVLSASPVACLDVKRVAEELHGCGRALVIDASLTGASGCAATRLGADVVLLPLGEALCFAGVARNAEKTLPGLTERLDRLPRIAADSVRDAKLACERSGRRWHLSSDAAQVLASYLRCHPSVAEVAYPGLKQDRSFSVAARTLQGGFGPIVDYRLKDDDAWQRCVCDAQDPRLQVMELEHRLSS